MTLFRRSDESCVARFAAEEVTVLRQVAAEVITLLTDDFDRTDPVIARLFPDAYPDDQEQAAEFRLYTEGDLKTAKIDQAGAILAALPASGGTVVRLDFEAAEAWLRAINDARLALGVRLKITADTDLMGEIDDAIMHDPTSARVRQLAWYDYLTELEESLVAAVSD